MSAAALAPHATDQPTDTALEVAHGVHVSCQEGRPTVTALCGVQLAWDDEEAPGARDICVVCLDLSRCPICGKQVGA